METKIELRSEEVQDIISQVPGWLLRWGISLIFLLFIMLLAISWFIRYPDVIKASVVVTTDPAPINLVTRASGKILLLRKENDLVLKDEVIAVLQTNAKHNYVLALEKTLAGMPSLDFENRYLALNNSLQIGDLQTFLNASIRSLQELVIFQKNELHKKQKAHLLKQIASYTQLNKNMANQLALMQQETALSHEQFKTDSLLFVQKVIAPADFNKAKGSFLVQQRALRNTEASIISNQLQIDALEKQLTELEIAASDKQAQLLTSSANSLTELNAQITKWKEAHLLTAPSNGSLAYLGIIENDQFIENGKPLFALIPNSKQLIAKAELPLAGAGKVKVGQNVNI